MVTSIQLGNFFTSGGKTVLGGVGGSGLDTESLVKGLADAKALPAKDLQTKIDKNDKVTAALKQFQTLVSTLKDATSFLSNPAGVGNQAQNGFLYSTASVVSNNSNDAANYLSMTTSPGVSPQSFSISAITSVAKAKQQSTDNITFVAPATSFDADSAFVTDVATPTRFTAGTVTVNGSDITLEAGDSLNQVAAKFNAVKADTGIGASVIKVSDNNYRLVFTATSTGTNADFNLNTAPSLDDPTASSISDPDSVFNGFSFTKLQGASNAEFTLNNVPIIRQNNAVSDVVSGITFNILQQTPGGTTLNATISADTTTAKNAIVNFVNAYNDLRIFAAKQMQVDGNGQYTADAVLASNTVFRNTVSTITNTLTQVVSGLNSGDPSRLSEVGVTFADLPASNDNPLVRNILDVNDGTLTSALGSNFDALRKVFEFDFSSDNPNLRIFSRSNALTVTDFTVAISAATPPDVPTATVTYGSGQTTTFDVAAIKDSGTGNVIGYTLKGKTGTPFSGLTLIYGSTAASTIAAHATQGIADKLYNTTESALTKDTGPLDVELAALKTSDDRLNTDISKINDQVAQYRQQLLDKFGALEQAISQINTILQSIDAESKARYGSNN